MGWGIEGATWDGVGRVGWGGEGTGRVDRVEGRAEFRIWLLGL